MSDDFKVSTHKYHYIKLKATNISTAFAVGLSFIGNASVVFADDIEAIVCLEKTGNWKIEPPEY